MAIGLMLVWTAEAAISDPLRVPEQFPTIEAALGSAVSGDTVLVSSGIYELSQPLTMTTPSVTLQSEEHLGAFLLNNGLPSPLITVGADSCGILDFDMFQFSLIRVIDVLPVSSVKISGNRIDGGGGAVAAVYSQASFTQVVDNEILSCEHPFVLLGQGTGLFEANDVHGNFAGVAVWAPCVIRNNQIMGARAGFDVGGSIHGAGIFAFGVDGHLLIQGNSIVDNWTSGETPDEFLGMGGGIWVAQCDSVTIENNLLVGNQATVGAGLYSENSTVEVRENVFWANYDSTNYKTNPVRGTGGGMYLSNCEGIAENNTFLDNHALVEGGAMFVDTATGIMEIRRNIIAMNWSQGFAVFCQSAVPIFECNDVWGNAGGSYGGDCQDPTGSNGNIAMDPAFCWPDTGNLRLLPISPCAPSNSPPGCGLIGAMGVGCPTSSAPSEGFPHHPAWSLLAVPNPVRFGATIWVAAGRTVNRQCIQIHDTSGRLIRSLELPDQPRGKTEVWWDGRSAAGKEVPSGTYFVRLSQEGQPPAKVLIVR